MKAMKVAAKKVATSGRAMKIEAPAALKAMKVVKKKAVVKVAAPVVKVKVEKSSIDRAAKQVPVATGRSTMDAQATRRRVVKAETPTPVSKKSAMKRQSIANEEEQAQQQKCGRSSFVAPIADVRGTQHGISEPVDDAQSCLARLRKALQVPIAEAITEVTPQRPALAPDCKAPQQQLEPVFSSSQIPGSSVEPGEMVIGGARKAWTCGCPAHLKRHSRCGGEGPVRVHLTRDVTVVGRGETCHVALRSIKTPQMISRNHAVIRREGSKFVIADQGSLNGVFINGERVLGERPVRSGDIVTFGAPIAEPEFDYIFEESSKV